MLTMKQIMELLKLSKQSAYNLVKEPNFPVVRVGKKIMIPADKLQKWIDGGGSRNEDQ